LSAGLILSKIHEEACDLNHTALIIHYNQSAGAYHSPDFFEGIKIKVHVKMVLRGADTKASSGRPADLYGFKSSSFNTSSNIKNNFSQCISHRNLYQSRIINITRKRKLFGSVIILRTEAFIPFSSVIDDRRYVAVCLNIIKYRRLVKKSVFNRSWRFNTRHSS